jgi:hypothetical protein
VNLGTIIVITIPGEKFGRNNADSDVLRGESLSYIDVAGRSITERIVDRYLGAGIDVVSVLIQEPTFGDLPSFHVTSSKVTTAVVADLHSAITNRLQEYSDRGLDRSFVQWADVYAETDLLDFFYFHRASKLPVTWAFDADGSLPMCVIDCADPTAVNLGIATELPTKNTASYLLHGYVKRFTHPRNLREFAADMLQGRCEARPSGQETKPGIWIDAGAELHRGARIVAPAYIGRGSKIMDDTLITRLTSIEKNCCVDCGTVIEDSSVLANTRVGIWLDVCHAVVSGNLLLSLSRDITVEVSDPHLIRSTATTSRSKSEARHRVEDGRRSPDLQAAPPLPEAWQFGSNFIRE